MSSPATTATSAATSAAATPAAATPATLAARAALAELDVSMAARVATPAAPVTLVAVTAAPVLSRFQRDEDELFALLRNCASSRENAQVFIRFISGNHSAVKLIEDLIREIRAIKGNIHNNGLLTRITEFMLQRGFNLTYVASIDKEPCYTVSSDEYNAAPRGEANSAWRAALYAVGTLARCILPVDHQPHVASKDEHDTIYREALEAFRDIIWREYFLDRVRLLIDGATQRARTERLQHSAAFRQRLL